MKDFKLFPILNDDVQDFYTIELSQEAVLDENQAQHAVKYAKEKFNIPGKTFLLVSENAVYFVSKLGSRKNKYWKAVKIL